MSGRIEIAFLAIMALANDDTILHGNGTNRHFTDRRRHFGLGQRSLHKLNIYGRYQLFVNVQLITHNGAHYSNPIANAPKLSPPNQAGGITMSMLTWTPPEQLEAILFDLDGTLVDTDDMAVARLEQRLRLFLGERAKPAARGLVMKAETPANQFISLLDLLHLDRPLMGLIDRVDQWRGVCPSSKFHLIDGVQPLIVNLAERYRLGLVTTRTRYHIDQFLERFPEIAVRLQTTIGCHESHRLKPHPAPVLLAASQLGVDISRCLMVGDTAVDIRAGRAAGAWTAGVLCGFGREWELARAGAHIILPSTAYLQAALGRESEPPVKG